MKYVPENHAWQHKEIVVFLYVIDSGLEIVIA